MKESEMQTVADFIKKIVLDGADPKEIGSQVSNSVLDSRKCNIVGHRKPQDMNINNLTNCYYFFPFFLH